MRQFPSVGKVEILALGGKKLRDYVIEVHIIRLKKDFIFAAYIDV